MNHDNDFKTRTEIEFKQIMRELGSQILLGQLEDAGVCSISELT
jgi:hypothetical protein